MRDSLKSLESVLKTLENSGIEITPFHRIEREIEFKGTVFVTLIANGNFKVVYDVPSRKIEFTTMNSNRPITDAFINQVVEIKELLPLLQQGMDYIYKEKAS